MAPDSNDATSKLTGVALVLAYVKSRNLAYLEGPSGSFVMLNPVTKEFTIFGEAPVVAGSAYDDCAPAVLAEAQSNGAILFVEDGQCVCHFADGERRGRTYVEAAMRALVAKNAAKTRTRQKTVRV